MAYDWEKDLAPYTSQSNIQTLVKAVNQKIRKGILIKWLIIVADVVFIFLLYLLFGILNILKLDVKTGAGLMNGIIAVELAVINFLSPFEMAAITSKEVNQITQTEVTQDIMEKISKSVGKDTSGVSKFISGLGALAAFAIVLLETVKA